jgi:Uma2 family endonuclease
MRYSLQKGDKKYTFAEYLAMEEISLEKHDFYYGKMYAMAGSTKAHNNIILNIGAFFKRSKKSGCDIYIDGMKLEIEKNEFYVYPDLMYTCQDNLKLDDLFVKHPAIIFEMLSDSTALYDKEVKLKYYKKIESLNYYVLISQKEIMVELYARIENSQIWKYQTFESGEEIMEFDRLGITLSVAAIYDSVSFEVNI